MKNRTLETQGTKPKRDVVISLKNIHKTFATKGQKTIVLRGVDVDICRGELLMVFGPSGCGKSTLLNILVGLEKPDKGTVNFFGFDLWGLHEDDRSLIRKQNIGIMNQQQYWINSLPVIDNVAFPGQLNGESYEYAIHEADRKLTMVGMTHRKRYVPRELSSGEQQKISLARALMSSPKVIISDEPTGNLDIKSGQALMDLLTSLKEEGTTIVMVTHNPEYLSYADRIIFMLDGKIRKDLRPEKDEIPEIRREMTENLDRFIGEKEVDETVEEPMITKQVEEEYTDNLTTRVSRRLSGVIENIKDFWIYFFRILKFFATTVFLRVRQRFFSQQDTFAPQSRQRQIGKISPGIRNRDIISLSYRNIMYKKTRTLITMGAVGIGIGFVIFLTSIGYGLRNLIVSRIASVEDTRQIEITTPASSNLVMTDASVDKIAQVDHVQTVLPLISIASQVSYKDSLSDVVAYGVSPDYSKNSSINLKNGSFFELTVDSEDYIPEVVLNEEFINMLGVSPEEVLGKDVKITYIPLGKAQEGSIGNQAELSTDTDQSDTGAAVPRVHTVVGIVTDENPPVIYIPAKNVHQIGIDNYNQAVAILENSEKETSTKVRQTIEAMGYETRSTFDTISQIDRVFHYVNSGLFTVGLVALSVAVLGMINTLTVSLLERTHEVGLMKAIGMLSEEIRFLFISEAMLMSILGGLFGIIVGFIEGKALSAILSAISISRGEGALDVTTMPLYLLVVVILVSAFIGFVTGLYPSRRAVKMSALDALRYE
jgi:putative ABC transport system ATP-binding protein